MSDIKYKIEVVKAPDKRGFYHIEFEVTEMDNRFKGTNRNPRPLGRGPMSIAFHDYVCFNDHQLWLPARNHPMGPKWKFKSYLKKEQAITLAKKIDETIKQYIKYFRKANDMDIQGGEGIEMSTPVVTATATPIWYEPDPNYTSGFETQPQPESVVSQDTEEVASEDVEG